MQACADYSVPLLVLDRPNPNGDYVDGPVLEEGFRSFVGMHPIPLVHGLTVGELARMINGEGWLKAGAQCQLTVIPVAGYYKQRRYTLPVPPSPNLPNDRAVRFYPSLGLFEGTSVSVARGTEFPFQALGHPRDKSGAFTFVPRPVAGASENPKSLGIELRGDDLRERQPRVGLDLSYLIDWMQRSDDSSEAFFVRAAFFDKLAGTDQLRLALLAGKNEDQIRAQWQPLLRAYLMRRKPYLLYPDRGSSGKFAN